LKFCTSRKISLHNIDTETRLHSGRLGVRITTGHYIFLCSK